MRMSPALWDEVWKQMPLFNTTKEAKMTVRAVYNNYLLRFEKHLKSLPPAEEHDSSDDDEAPTQRPVDNDSNPTPKKRVRQGASLSDFQDEDVDDSMSVVEVGGFVVESQARLP